MAEPRLDLGEKLCTKCGLEKPRSEFSHRLQKAGCKVAYLATNAYCKKCAAAAASRRYKESLSPEQRKNRALKRTVSRYGLTLADYDRLLRAQDGCCAICRTDVPGGPGRFHVDHCHSTGAVRGLLCVNCNRGIGALHDDPELLRCAIAYLEADRVRVAA